MTRAKNLQSSETKEGLLLISMEMNIRDIIRDSFLSKGISELNEVWEARVNYGMVK